MIAPSKVRTPLNGVSVGSTGRTPLLVDNKISGGGGGYPSPSPCPETRVASSAENKKAGCILIMVWKRLSMSTLR